MRRSGERLWQLPIKFKMNLDTLLKEQTPIVFYDHHCGICNKLIFFFLSKTNPSNPLYFAPLHGEKFKKILLLSQIQEVEDTIYIYLPKEKRLRGKSEACLSIFKHLRFPWKSLGWIIKIFPLPVANKLYDFFAKKRSFFSKATRCNLISKKMSKYLE